MSTNNHNFTEDKIEQCERVVNRSSDMTAKVGLSWTSTEFKNIQRIDVISPRPVTTKVRLFDTLIEKVGRLEGEVCFYTMEVEELGSPLGRLRTIQAYFEKMEYDWGIHRNIARKLLEEVLKKKGLSDSTVFRLLPPELKDPVKRANRLGKSKSVESQTSPFPATAHNETGVGACYQDPD